MMKNKWMRIVLLVAVVGALWFLVIKPMMKKPNGDDLDTPPNNI